MHCTSALAYPYRGHEGHQPVRQKPGALSSTASGNAKRISCIIQQLRCLVYNINECASSKARAPGYLGSSKITPMPFGLVSEPKQVDARTGQAP
jgi:hypothetical protein